MNSMTGFGRTEISNDMIKAVVEIKTVNHRFCDIFIKGPRNYGFLEDKIKKILNDGVSRGKIDVYYYYDNKEESPIEVVFNENLTDKYKQALEKITDRYNIFDSITLSNILVFPDIIKTEACTEKEDILWEKLGPLFIEATEKLLEMRRYEGDKTKKDLIDKLDNIEELRKKIEIKAPEVPLDFGMRLKKNIEKYMGEQPIDESRIAIEIAVFADKCTVDEELTRLKSHIVQFKETMDTDIPIGRKLDFLVQEMNRETNTIGSKANDLEITQNVVEIKSELEKIREQVQNIE
jgi:uncharacterized protein (TIGR00255 family)